MNRDALLTIVAEWLEATELPTMVAREHPPIDIENLKRILAVVGPRRAGKTYFMYQLIRSLIEMGHYEKRDILFLDFEDYRLSGFTQEDVEPLFTAFHQLAGRDPRFIFFDEVQRLPEWGRVLRTLHNRRNLKIVISGSNSKLLHPEVATELRGRYEDLLLLPFSFREYIEYRKLTPTLASLHTPARGKIVAAFDEFLHHGGFPEVVLASGTAERRRLLQNYLRTIFYKDIMERHNIKARQLLDAMLSDMLETYSEIFSISRFEKQLKGNGLAGSKRTISNYLAFIEESFFAIVNERYSTSPRRRLMSPKKLYLLDTGFTGLGNPTSENLGKLLENLVAIDLHRRGQEVFYFKGQRECDFIIKKGLRPTQAIQVCWDLNARTEKRELGGLAEACGELHITDALVLTHAQEGKRSVDMLDVTILPVWRWLIQETGE